MRIIKPYVQTLTPPRPAEELYAEVELAGRICYKSTRKDGEKAEDFIRRAIKVGHESILEHAKISLIFVCDRGVSHEIVRHRIASYSQESTRYCNYSKDQFNGEITVIEPNFLVKDSPCYRIWKKACEFCETAYFDLLGEGCSPQQARAVLPNSLKTEIVVTMNIREWRHFLKLRYLGTSGTPHPQMVEVAELAYKFLVCHYPAFFDDLKKAD